MMGGRGEEETQGKSGLKAQALGGAAGVEDKSRSDGSTGGALQPTCGQPHCSASALAFLDVLRGVTSAFLCSTVTLSRLCRELPSLITGYYSVSICSDARRSLGRYQPVIHLLE